MLWNGYLWESRRQIIWRRIKLIITLVIVTTLVVGYVLYDCFYIHMSHFNKEEQQWAQPFIKEGVTKFIGTNGDKIKTKIESTIYNRSKWWRLHTPFYLCRDGQNYNASMWMDYEMSDGFGMVTTHIFKPLSDDSIFIEWKNRVYIHLTKVCYLDTIKLSTITIKEKQLTEAFYVEFPITEPINTISPMVISSSIQGHNMRKFLWSKPLGLVYFMTIDSAEYFRSDVFFDTHIGDMSG